MPNLIETVVAMLAATSIGAVWSSCATDIGSDAALDRLGQVQPTVLITADGYFYKGRTFRHHSCGRTTGPWDPLAQRVVVVPYTQQRPILDTIPNAILLG